MTKTMQEVLAEHTSATYDPDYDGQGNSGIWCDQCAEGQDGPNVPEDEWLAAHQSAALSAAGYGLVADAAADAWDACINNDTPWINPYRKASNDDQ